MDPELAQPPNQEIPTKLSLAQRFGLFFYDRRELTVLFWVALVIFGVFSYGVMKRQGFPAVDVPFSVMSGTYFVNDPAKVDQAVTQPASEVITDLPEVEAVTAQAGDNYFSIIVEFVPGTTSAEGTEKVRRAVEARARLPQDAQAEFKPINATKFADEFDVLVSVYQPLGTIDVSELEHQAAEVTQRLQNSTGVARAEVLEQYETGRNPQTGQTATEKQHFDRIGFRQNNGTVFYPAVTIGIIGEANQDAIELSEHVDQALAGLTTNPAFGNLETRISADFAEGIEAQTSSLERSLLEGLVVVLIVSFLLISWRASLTSALSMITVMLLTMATLKVTGNTLNTVTLFALILSLGLIVDDTTIKVEAMDAAKRESRRKRDIVALAAKRVSRASAAGTFVTMLGFAPMLFVGGVLGDFIRVLPVTIIISLAYSLLVSLVLVPLLSSFIILRGLPKESGNPVGKLEQLLSSGLAGLLSVGKRSRVKGALIGLVAISISAVMIAASVLFFQKLKFDIFPATKDTDTLQVNVRFPSRTSVGQAEETVDRLNVVIAETLVGNLRRLSYQSSGTPQEAVATIDLISFKEREPTSPELVQHLERAFTNFDGAEVKVSQVDAGPPEEDLPFQVQIANKDRTTAIHLAEDLVTWLRSRTVERVNGTTARIVQAEIINPSQVTRTDGDQVIVVGAAFDADDTSALVTAAQDDVETEFTGERLESYGLSTESLRFDFGSESENQESFQTMVIAFPILIVTMYVLMALQFRSYLQPLLIFSAIPYSLFGVAVGLYLTDNPLSFFVLVGFFALIGIALNNTILLTDYANQARQAGYGRIDAIAGAVRARFRPLLTTSLTSVVALIPLALSDPFWESLSVTLICGLLSSTFLVVITFPYIYLAGEVLRLFGSRLWRRQLSPVIQYPLDVLIAPVRIIYFFVFVIFRLIY